MFPCGVGRPDELRQRAGERSKTFLALLERVFKPFALSNIRTIAGQQLRAPVEELRHIDQAGELASIPTQMLVFKHVPAFFARNAQRGGEIVMRTLRYQGVQSSPEQFTDRIAVHGRERGIHVDDRAAVRIGDEHAEARAGEDLLPALQLALRDSAGRHIPKNQYHAEHFARFVAYGRAAVLDRYFLPVLRYQDAVLRQPLPHLLALHRAERVLQRLSGSFIAESERCRSAAFALHPPPATR